jgi:D-aminoacyl-tRNA deacylase
VGLAKGDTKAEIETLARRILRLRAFSRDEAGAARGDNAGSDKGEATAAAAAGPWTASVCGVGGEVLLVSQFTLHARTNRRSRPDFSRAMPPGEAAGRWAEFVGLVRREGLALGARGVFDGAFGQMMQVRIHNDGPVTFVLDTDAEGGASGASGATGATGATGSAATETPAEEGGGEGEGGGGVSSSRRREEKE